MPTNPTDPTNLTGPAGSAASASGGRQDRRKAVTRAKILTAAERLFGARGYAETSIEEISEAADVAVRTIYVHFASKAAIMLAGFDAWVDAFVAGVARRPVDEPVVETVQAVLQEMRASGWEDHPENDDTPVHPMVGHLYSGSPDVAGHVLQRWMREVDRLAQDATARGGFPDGSLVPQARAVAMFSAWIGALSAAGARERGRPLPPGATGHGLGLDILSIVTKGGI